MGVTINDIAKKVGINPAWVSKTLRRHPDAAKLKEETRIKILETAKEMGYRRNELAVSMRTGIVRNIAMIYADFFSNFYIAGIMKSLFISLKTHGYGLQVYDDADLKETLDLIAGSGIRHILAASVEQDKREIISNFAEKYGIRLVFLYESMPDRFPVIDVDNFAGGRLAAEKLIACGHRRIAFFCRMDQFLYQKTRYAGFVSALQEAGILPDESLISCDDRTCEQDAGRMFALPASLRPTAAFCISDELAIRVQQTAVLAGLHLPEDLSVIGYGNFREAEHAISPLTTIEEHHGEWGRQSIPLLLDGTCGIVPVNGNEYRVPPSLIERESVCDNREKTFIFKEQNRKETTL